MYTQGLPSLSELKMTFVPSCENCGWGCASWLMDSPMARVKIRAPVRIVAADGDFLAAAQVGDEM
jgi:hypothetical protein